MAIIRLADCFEAATNGTPGVTKGWEGSDRSGRFVEFVDKIRDVTTRPIITVARALVLGLVMACCALAAVVLTGIGLFRLLDIVLPGKSWSAHLVLGAACCTLGALLWSRRTP